ncbi:hypothetical protein ACE38U_02310 [Cedecea sp. S5-13]|uniref:hypothetical protein n=1 Tax=Cedecea selenatireducens TaxID=3144416 RepID=UPI0035CD02FB
MVNYISFFLFASMLVYFIKGPIDHRKCVVFGALYYFILPIIVGENFFFFDVSKFDQWFDAYRRIEDEDKLFFLANALLMVLFYILGSALAYRGINKDSLVSSKVMFSKNALGMSGSIIIGLVVLAFTSIIWFVTKDLFFRGYTDTYNTGLMGQMASLNLLILVTVFYTRNVMKKILIFTLLCNSIFLLSMGGRMYVITCALFVVFYFFDGKKPPKLLIFLMALLCASLVVTGMLRVGNTNGLSNFVYIALAEPVFTSFSALTFLVIPDNFNLLSLPTNFFNSFLMLAPNIMDYKQYIHVDIESMGYRYSSPLGATSVFVSLMANFGIIGTYFFMLILGFFVSRFQVSNKIHVRTLYLMSCATLPFMFYRDGFGIINKVVFFTGLIIPCIYVFTSKVLTLLKKGSDRDYY